MTAAKLSTTPCKNGHVGLRYKNGNCRQCLLDREKTKYHTDPEFKLLKKQREAERHRRQNPNPKKQRLPDDPVLRKEIKRQNNARYVVNNLEKVKLRQKAYRERTKESRREKNAESFKQHYLANKSYYTEKRTRRRLITKQQTPAWADLEKIRKIYKESSIKSTQDNVAYSVEHIVPLYGKNPKGEHVVCGLHTEANLTIITLEENKKRNAYAWYYEFN